MIANKRLGFGEKQRQIMDACLILLENVILKKS
jgi:hypothetical protein